MKEHEEQQQFAEKDLKIEERLWLDATVGQFDNVLRLNYNKPISDFSKIVLDYASEITNAYLGVFYMHNLDTNIIEAVAGFAYNIEKHNQEAVELQQGVVVEAIKSKKTIFFKDLAPQHMEIKSSILKISATSILIVPLIFNDKAFGAIEMIFLRNLEPKYQQLLEVVSRNVAAMLESIINNEMTKLLLQQSQQQMESLQAQEEELRQNMEELQTTQEQMRQKNIEIENRITAIDNSGIASVELDLNANILAVNEAFLKISGYSRSDLIGKNHKILVDKNYESSADYQKFWINLKKGQAQTGEFTFLGKDEKEIYVIGAYSIIKNVAGDAAQIFTLFTDISNTKLLLKQSLEQGESLRAQEEELRQNMEELQVTQEQMVKKQTELDAERAKNELIRQQESERAAKVAEMQKKAMLSTTQKLKAKLEEIEKIKEEEANRAIRVAEMQKQTVNKIIVRLKEKEEELDELKKNVKPNPKPKK